MEKKRVEKGMPYWYITLKFTVDRAWEQNDPVSKLYFINNNYFTTKEEAETMARKIRAVLDGADVIQMPNEKEIIKEETSCNPFRSNNWDGTLSGYENGLCNGFSKGFGYCINWLKTKTVK